MAWTACASHLSTEIHFTLFVLFTIGRILKSRIQTERERVRTLTDLESATNRERLIYDVNQSVIHTYFASDQ